MGARHPRGRRGRHRPPSSSTSWSRGVSVIGVLPQGLPVPSWPGRPWGPAPALFAAAVGISLVAIGDTISTSGGFATRSGYEVDGEPGARGHRIRQPGRRALLRLPGEHERLPDGGGLPVGREPQLTGLVAAGLVAIMLAFAPGLGPGDATAGPGRGHHRGLARACSTSPRCDASTTSEPRNSPWPWRAASASRSSASSRGSSSRSRCRRCTSSSEPGPRTRRSSGRCRAFLATTTSDAGRTRSRSRDCSSSVGPPRSSSPTRMSSETGSGRPSRRPTRHRSGSSSPPSRSPTSTRRPGRCSRTSISNSTPAASTSPSPSSSRACATPSAGTGSSRSSRRATSIGRSPRASRGTAATGDGG